MNSREGSIELTPDSREECRSKATHQGKPVVTRTLAKLRAPRG